jgi:hypothetical protein
MTQKNESLRKTTFLGLFLVSLSTLMYEILLTRIFSVTMWYHFAFMAISIAMFGMTAGALAVYLLPRLFSQEATQRRMAQSALLFSATIVGSFIVSLQIPAITDMALWWKMTSSLGAIYAIVSVPFFFSGVCICLALTKHPDTSAHCTHGTSWAQQSDACS